LKLKSTKVIDDGSKREGKHCILFVEKEEIIYFKKFVTIGAPAIHFHFLSCSTLRLKTIGASLSPRPLQFTTTLLLSFGNVGTNLSNIANACVASRDGYMPSNLHNLSYAANSSTRIVYICTWLGYNISIPIFQNKMKKQKKL
jgi:hypothetical protein